MLARSRWLYCRCCWLAGLDLLSLRLRQPGRSHPREKLVRLYFKRLKKATNANSRRSSDQKNKSFHREMKSRTSSNGNNLARSIRRCTVLFEKPTGTRSYTSARRIGLFPSRWSPRMAHGASIPMPARMKSCSGPSEKMRRQQFWYAATLHRQGNNTAQVNQPMTRLPDMHKALFL